MSLAPDRRWKSQYRGENQINQPARPQLCLNPLVGGLGGVRRNALLDE